MIVGSHDEPEEPEVPSDEYSYPEWEYFESALISGEAT